MSEMASIRLDQNGDCIDNSHVQKLPSDSNTLGEAEVSPQLPSYLYDVVDAFGESEILPRVGDEYQVELPRPTGESDRISHPMKSTYAENSDDDHQKFLVGLPITLTWISSEHEPSHHSRQSMGESQDLPTSENICKRTDPGYHLVPGLDDENWSAAEKDCFLLGLYIFEKNFVEVRRFVGTKEMGALLSYYYGKFYHSPEYCRWSECRKTKKKKKCIFGQRIFSGPRQQELLSRILPRVSEECQNALLEVSKTFGDEKMSLADFVFSLKTMVGTKILVHAVGIGKGKQDLTQMALEPSRPNQVIHMRPEIPSGKACSSLTTTEIIKFLSGGYRLSKARSNDLFWEAVWPRLLARGWHSEQPRDRGFVAGSKQCLVFLMPGIKKFSRRKLVKGDQYFDSVTDVLSKVSREPGLIELNAEADGSKIKEEHEWRQNDDGLPKNQRHSYLQPRTPNGSTVVMKFTVVDTSLSDGKVRELRTFPSEISAAFSAPDDTDEDTTEENIDESDTTDITMVDALATDVSPKTTKRDENVSAMDQDAHTVYPDNNNAASMPEETKEDLQEKTQSRKVSESLLSEVLERENVNYTAPMNKRSRILTACSQEEKQAGLLSSSIPPRSEDGMSNRCSDTSEVSENLLSQVSQCLDKLPSTGSSRGSPRGSIENNRNHMLIDLNVLPPVPPDTEDDITSNERVDHSVPQSDVQATSMEQSNMNTRRHSTRVRPLTTRALEAFANGYFTVNRRQKRKETSSDDSQSSRPSQRACGVVRCDESTDSVPAFQSEAAETGASNSVNSNMFLNTQVPPEVNEESVSGHY